MEKMEMPYVVHEGEMMRLCKIVRWLCAIIVILIVLLVGTNLAWLHYESQFEDVSVDQQVEQDAESGTNYFYGISPFGGELNGEAES